MSEFSLSHGVFCPGCNARFEGDSAEGFCPRCGMRLPSEGSIPSEQPTFLCHDRDGPSTGGAAALSECARDAPRLMPLIGGDLHIYHIESLLGRGGMGWVFLARHRDLHRPCALKILAPTLAAKDPDYVERFQNEGRAAAALVHPNIVTTHAIGTVEGLHFLEMEFLRGRSLQQRIKDQPLSPVEGLSTALGIAEGLSVAHREGIIHRDLKPDNVLLTHQGCPKITDFGLAKRIVRQGGDTEQVLAGTPHYMAPELFQGSPPSPASDVYALGVCLYVMLTAQYPFTGPKLSDLIAAVTTESLPNLRALNPQTPLEVSECVYAMLSRSPGNRPRDGIEAAQLLRAVLGNGRDLEALLHEALDDEPGIEWTSTPTGYVATVELAAGRKQRVYLDPQDRPQGGRLVSIYSVCGPAAPDHYAGALRLNARIIHGALAVRDVDGTPHFVVLNNYPRSTVDAEEIRESVLDAAEHGDAMEQLLTGQDRF